MSNDFIKTFCGYTVNDIKAMEKRIVELEQQSEARLQEAKIQACELDTQKSIVRDLLNEVGLRVHDYHCISAFKKTLKQRELEMQLKTADSFLNMAQSMGKFGRGVISDSDAIRKRNKIHKELEQLRNQAK